PLGIGDVGENERAAFIFRHATDKLPAHQRVQLGILVDGCVDPLHEAQGIECSEMFLEIEAGAAARGGLAAQVVGLVEHFLGRPSWGRRPYHSVWAAWTRLRIAAANAARAAGSQR